VLVQVHVLDPGRLSVGWILVSTVALLSKLENARLIVDE
jgi:hypothetical protein